MVLFRFLKYLYPTHYFQLHKKDGYSIFPLPQNLQKEIIDNLIEDKSFKSQVARQYDLSWQAINNGYVGNAETYKFFETLPIEDEYRFIRKYFNGIWVWYILILRLVSLYDPVREISSWSKSKDAERMSFLPSSIPYKKWENFKSALISENPLVTVIIPTLNRYKYLKDVLLDLEQQDYKNFEVIIVDQSNPFQKDFYSQFKLDIQLIQQEERALWLARNHAVQISKGEFLLLFDDDSRVDPDWVSSHLKCLDFFHADVSSGVSISTVGAEIPVNYSFFHFSSQLDTGNVLIKKEVFRKIGLFDRQFEKQRMGDGEYGLRCYLNGFRNISNPYAKRLHLKVGSGGLREMGSWDAFRTKKWFAPRPIPSVLYFYRTYFGKQRSILALFKTVPVSIMPYRFKSHKGMMLLGVLISVFLFPVVLVQVFSSWSLASRKLKAGARIGKL